MVYYIIALIIDVILLPICASSIPVYMDDPSSIPLTLVIAAVLIPLSFIIISIVGLKKRLPVGGTLLLKVAFFLLFGGVSFLGFEDGIYAFGLFELGALLFFFASWVVINNLYYIPKKEKNKRANMPKFSYVGQDKLPMVFEEWAKDKGVYDISSLSSTEKDMVLDYSVMPLVYYFYWLLDKGFVKTSLKEKIGGNYLDKLKKREITPLELLKKCNYQLNGEDLSDTGLRFTLSYFDSRIIVSDDAFLFDYYEEVKESDGNFYVVAFSWDSCDRLHAKIDEAYRRWSVGAFLAAEYDVADPEMAVDSKLFNTSLEVYKYGEKKQNNITEDYIRRCISDLDSIDTKQLERLDRWISDVYGEELRGQVLSHFRPQTVYVMEPQGNDVVYAVSGGADFEEEHGISFSVRNGIIFDHGYSYDFDGFYESDCVAKYEMAASNIAFTAIKSMAQVQQLVSEGRIVKTHLLPLSMGGTDDEKNTIYITPAALEKKQQLDKKAEMLFAIQNKKHLFDYKAHYYDENEKYIPDTIYIRNDENNLTRLSYSIKVWR